MDFKWHVQRTVDNFVIKLESKALCLLWNDIVAMLKKHNRHRHYWISTLIATHRKAMVIKIKKFKWNISSQQNFFFTKIKSENEPATNVSF